MDWSRYMLSERKGEKPIIKGRDKKQEEKGKKGNKDEVKKINKKMEEKVIKESEKKI